MPLIVRHARLLTSRATCAARTLGWLCALAITIAVSGCGTSTPFGGGFKTDSVTTPRRSTVCVVSALGSNFGVDTLGLTMFGSDHSRVPVDSWQVDDFVTMRIGELLGTQLNIQRVAAPANAFAALDQSGALFRNIAAERADILRKLVLGERCDYHLLVERASSTVGTTNQKVTGYGIVRSGDGLIVDNVHLYALANIVLYDNQGFKVLSEYRLEGPGGIFKTISGPHRKLDASAWPSPPRAADNPNLKAGILSLIDAGLVSTAPDIVKQVKG